MRARVMLCVPSMILYLLAGSLVQPAVAQAVDGTPQWPGDAGLEQTWTALSPDGYLPPSPRDDYGGNASAWPAPAGPLASAPATTMPVEPSPWPSITPLPGPDAALIQPPTQPGPPAPLATPAVVAVPKDEKPIKLWEGSLQLGLSGTDGNSQDFNLKFGGKLKRKTNSNALTADFDYKRNQSGTQVIADQGFLDGRWEWFFKDTPWTWFTHTRLEHDEFQAYDLRWSIDTGVGYRWLKNDCTTLTTRAGGGTSREFGGPDDQWIPEAVFGVDFEHKLNKQQKLTFTAEYIPNVTDFADYRINAKAAWEIVLSEAMNLSLKLQAADRYDSTPHGKKPNDVDYGALLMWSF